MDKTFCTSFVEGVRPEIAKIITQNSLWKQMDESDGTKSFRSYLQADYVKTASTVRRSLEKGSDTFISRLRVGDGKLVARIGLVGSQWKHRCPFCDKHKGESLEHLLLRCKAWSHERDGLNKLLVNIALTGRQSFNAINLLGGCLGDDQIDLFKKRVLPQVIRFLRIVNRRRWSVIFEKNLFLVKVVPEPMPVWQGNPSAFAADEFRSGLTP